jgi:hypothetical protein
LVGSALVQSDDPTALELHGTRGFDVWAYFTDRNHLFLVSSLTGNL